MQPALSMNKIIDLDVLQDIDKFWTELDLVFLLSSMLSVDYNNYVTGRLLLFIPLKQRGFSDFQITTGISFPPATLTIKHIENRCLLFYHLYIHSFFGQILCQEGLSKNTQFHPGSKYPWPCIFSPILAIFPSKSQ